jgi:hypothetical protein
MNQNFTIEDLKYNKAIKKSFFEVLLEQVETFYLHCVNHSKLSIGTRGLLEKEQKEGIILVFGPYSYRKLDWDEDGIYCEMNFGKWENIYIPYECIFRVFDKAGHFMMQFLTMEIEYEKTEVDQRSKLNTSEELDSEQTNVIQIDFSKKNKKKKE